MSAYVCTHNPTDRDHDVDSEDMYDETEEEDEGGYEDSLRGQSDPDDEGT